MAKTKRLPCPFCGSKRLRVLRSEDDPNDKSVGCLDCYAAGPVNNGKHSASYLWNRRVSRYVRGTK